MKKTFAIVLILVMALGLTGCASNNNDDVQIPNLPNMDNGVEVQDIPDGNTEYQVWFL